MTTFNSGEMGNVLGVIVDGVDGRFRGVLARVTVGPREGRHGC